MTTTELMESMNMSWRIKCSQTGYEMWKDVQKFKQEVKIGDVFKVPENYYMNSLPGAEWNSPLVEMTVTEKYPDVITLTRQGRCAPISISPDYTKLFMFERDYGSNRVK